MDIFFFPVSYKYPGRGSGVVARGSKPHVFGLKPGELRNSFYISGLLL